MNRIVTYRKLVPRILSRSSKGFSTVAAEVSNSTTPANPPSTATLDASRPPEDSIAACTAYYEMLTTYWVAARKHDLDNAIGEMYMRIDRITDATKLALFLIVFSNRRIDSRFIIDHIQDRFTLEITV